jgi:predicted nucleic acid-binding protein
MIFLDSNILTYASGFHGRADPRTGQAQALLNLDRPYAVSVQVFGEFYDRVRRGKHTIPEEYARELLAEWRFFKVQPLTLELFDLALSIRTRHKFRYYDCAILAAAALCGADTVLSEDMNDGQVVNGVRIFNPFRTDA